ncbi:MAG TPA: aspartate dehydrogenase [Candidatus Sulfotelmatobacter sp.]|nr:aspartate dehydrogenase [Candidatus Sulfotelmatobacter sp.]
MPPARPHPLGVGIAGLGTIGMALARRLHAGVPHLRLAAATSGDADRARARLGAAGIEAPVLPLAALVGASDVVVECAPAAAFRGIAEAAVGAGRIFMPLSVGALLDHLDLVDRAAGQGARIIVPTGALIGLDAVRAAAEGTIHSVTLVSRKPPAGLIGAPYLVERGISLAGLAAPLRVFAGNARDGARGFPANVNIAAALGLAGIGPERTALEIWADPTVTRNTHRIEVEADSARFAMTIENVPSAENPRTGKITALSVIACLRGLTGTLKVGT